MAGPPRWLTPLLLCLLVAGFAAGIWGTYRAAFPAKDLYRVTGTFQGRANDTLFLVAHDPVPGLMEQMPSMACVAESAALLDRARLTPGDRVRLTVRQAPDRLIAVEIMKVH
jgi:hypothetical protein